MEPWSQGRRVFFGNRSPETYRRVSGNERNVYGGEIMYRRGVYGPGDGRYSAATQRRDEGGYGYDARRIRRDDRYSASTQRRDRGGYRHDARRNHRADQSRKYFAKQRKKNLTKARSSGSQNQNQPLENILGEKIHMDGEDDLSESNALILAPTEIPAETGQRFMSFDNEGNIVTQENPVDSMEMLDENTDQDEQEEVIERQKLLSILPGEIRVELENHPSLPDIKELVLDLGRKAELRCEDHKQELSTNITDDHIILIVNQLNQLNQQFSDNRCGVDGTIHRISRRVGQDGTSILGFTIRFGKMRKGITRIISDLIAKRKSVLFIGRPGVGKTTLLREYARKLSEETVGVEVIDKNNEIGGDSNIPHRCIGSARRLMVPIGKSQYDVMREAVQNHAPDCIIVDEVVKKEEAEAIADISKRGVKIIATIHADKLEKLIDNDQLNLLTGGKKRETVSDRFFIDNKLKGKTIVKRASEPCFDCVVELQSRYRWALHPNMKKAVDCILESRWRKDYPKLPKEVRTYTENGQMVLGCMSRY